MQPICWPVKAEHHSDRRCGHLQILRMRYGLHRPDGQGMTLSDVSAAYGCTKERVRQLEELAMFKLRRHRDVLTTHLTMAGANFDGTKLPEREYSLKRQNTMPRGA